MLHFPVSLPVGTQRIPLHGLFEALGTFAGFRYFLWLKKKQGDAIEKEHRIWIIIAATIGAVLGARILGTMEDIPGFLASTDKLAYFWGNKTLLGGLMGGLLGVEGIKKILGEQQASGDLFVFPLLLAMIIGRIGCFTAGIYEETYGLPTRLPWGMDLGDGQMRHPVTLYEIAFLILFWRVPGRLKRKYTFAPGALFKLFMAGYALFRLVLDFIKPGWRYFFGLGTIQLSSIAVLLYYYRYILQPRRLIVAGKHNDLAVNLKNTSLN